MQNDLLKLDFYKLLVSPIWEYFVKVKNNRGKARCTVEGCVNNNVGCGRTWSATNNLYKHIKAWHRHLHEELQAKKKQFLANRETRQSMFLGYFLNILNKDYLSVFCLDAIRSYFTIEEESKELNIATCNECGKILTSNNRYVADCLKSHLEIIHKIHI